MDATAVLLCGVVDQLAALRSARSGVDTAVAEAMGHFRGADLDDPDIQRAASAAARLIALIAEDASPEDAQPLLSALSELGAAGENALSGLLLREGLHPEKLRTLLEHLPHHRQLAQINLYFMFPRRLPRAITAVMDERLAAIQKTDPDAVLMFLATQTAADAPVAFPIQHALLRGRFRLWLEELLAMDLDEQQRRYMARTISRLHAPELAPKLARLLAGASVSVIVPLLGSLGALAPNTGDNPAAHKTALRAVHHSSPAVRLAALRLLRRFDAPEFPAEAARLFTEAGEQRADIAVVLLSSPWAAQKNALRHLAPAERVAALGVLAQLAAHAAPKIFAKAGVAPRVPAPNPPEVAIPPVPQPKPDPDQTPPPEPSSGLMGRMKDLMGGKSTAKTAAPPHPLAALGKGRTLEGQTIQGGVARAARLQSVTVKGCTIKDVTLIAASVRKTSFTDCQFHNTDMTWAAMTKVTFSGCTFRGVRFSFSRLKACTFVDCTFTGCLFDGARCDGCGFGVSTLARTSLAGTQFTDCRMRSCTLLHVDATLSVWTNADCAGTAFRDVLLARAAITGGSFMLCPCHGLRVLGTAVRGVTSDEAALLAAQDDWTLRRIEAVAATNDDVAPAPKAAPKVLLAALERAATQRDAACAMRGWLHANRLRLDWSGVKLGSTAPDIEALIPILMEAPALPADGSPAPGARISGFVPTLAALNRAREVLGEETLAATDRDAAPIAVESVCSIGSIGTIVQTGRSDIDIWVCWKEDAAEAERADAFRAKLRAIEEWADDAHGLEVHFFVMDHTAIQNNNFGFSDAESVGSSQALLLKEEFYRTAVVLAGRPPAWWCAPPGAGAAETDAALARVAASGILPRGHFIDLGHLPQIPPEEFFGASLWQIVKALKSPFKSILKFALLDTYTGPTAKRTLLCETVKASVTTHTQDFWRLDPYALLYKCAHEHFRATGRMDALHLLDLAFDSRTGFTRREGLSVLEGQTRGYTGLEFVYPYVSSQLPSGAGLEHISRDDNAASFAQQMQLGKRVASFLFSTYENIQKSAGAQGVLITQDDVTRLGRKIFAHFQPRQDKILHIPFMNSPHGIFTGVHISSVGIPGTPVDWIATGELPAQPGSKKKQTEEIRRHKSLAHLLLWLVANGLYTPGMSVSGSDLLAPVSQPNIVDLLDTLHRAFRKANVFETSIEETMTAERVTHAAIVVNLMTERDDPAYRDVVLAYTNNWGELFCTTTPKRINLLQTAPRDFVAANTTAAVDSATTLACWLPKKALAPKPNLGGPSAAPAPS